MQVVSAEFIKSAVKPAGYPESVLPEVAFVGRSNVGKSSLINVLVNRKSLVRTSRTPGRTQLINFFDINHAMTLVDLPGYGFAKVPLAVKKAWGPMIRGYLGQRENLRAVIFILDVRRVPNADDLEMLDWLEEFEIPTIPVVTKVDKLSKNEVGRQLKKIAEVTGLPEEAFSLFSAHTRRGKDEVWERIGVATEEGAESTS
ncbi:MAG: YihA family ribosome biogenesis GTP-binding protein [Desulfuromonas sp.]|nr:MAG: YihA family ribosome biogenesis GTP-binding protein [Desulfuromonas sp.]